MPPRRATQPSHPAPDDAGPSIQPNKYTPRTYRPLKTEQGVFLTPPYSGEIKVIWRIKDAAQARRSAEGIWKMFEDYRDRDDFVGMDISRKFLQMGRTRSLRYALRPGGRKYDPETGAEMARTGQVYDQGKKEGAGIFEGYWKRCWEDEVYQKAWDEWRTASGMKSRTSTSQARAKGEVKDKVREADAGSQNQGAKPRGVSEEGGGGGERPGSVGLDGVNPRQDEVVKREVEGESFLVDGRRRKRKRAGSSHAEEAGDELHEIKEEEEVGKDPSSEDIKPDVTALTRQSDRRRAKTSRRKLRGAEGQRAYEC